MCKEKIISCYELLTILPHCEMILKLPAREITKVFLLVTFYDFELISIKWCHFFESTKPYRFSYPADFAPSQH